MSDTDPMSIAHIAFSHYPIDTIGVEFLRHNENLTYKITGADEQRHLLRIHKPVTQAFHMMPMSSALLESELLWLEALACDTNIKVQTPVRNRFNKLVTQIADGSPLFCTMLNWVDGEGMLIDTPEAPNLMSELGELIAGLHSNAGKWAPPPGFIRPSYDAERFHTVVEILRESVEMGILTSDELELMEETAKQAVTEMVALRKTTGSWGLIHADISPGNLLVSDGVLMPIDFSLCGFGPYAWDLGSGLANFPSDLRKYTLEAYCNLRPLPADHLRLMEGCCVLGILSCFAFNLQNPAKLEWLHRRMPMSVDREWKRYLRGESFFFEI